MVIISRIVSIIYLTTLGLSYHAQQEICNNGIDDDNDGQIDLNDSNCNCGSSQPISQIDSVGNYCDTLIFFLNSTSVTLTIVNYQWYKDGIAISGEISSTLNMSARTNGDYSLMTIYANGWCSISNVIHLDIPTPIMSDAGVDKVICINSMVTMTANLTNSGLGTWSLLPGAPGSAIILNNNSSSTGITGFSAIGDYFFKWFISNPPCGSATDTVKITVTPIDDPAFNYSNTIFCATSTDPLPLVTGTMGGTFTSSPSGLSINTNTGEINLNASSSGSYSITYTTPNCFESSSTIITISPTNPATTFGYANSPYCSGAGTIPATLFPTSTPGIFTVSPSGLQFSDAVGTIDLSLSNPGTYTIYNQIPAVGNCGSALDSTSITIRNLDPTPIVNYPNRVHCLADPTEIPSLISTVPGFFNSSPSGLSINSTTGEITPSMSSIGMYTVTYTTTGPCPNYSSANIVITPVNDASFSYPRRVYCVNHPDPSPTITGVSGGIFTSNPIGLVIDPISGRINLSSSNTGSYTVTYTSPGGTNCSNYYTASIIVNAMDNASFSYNNAIFCAENRDTVPTINGMMGGQFNCSSTGIVLDSISGEVDLGASAPDTYSIIYTTNGTCPNYSIESVTIDPMDDPSFLIADTAFCIMDNDPTPVITGMAGGTFSSSTSGLNLDPNTGQIDLDQSLSGAYDLIYSTNGICPNSKIITIRIDSLEDPSFNYSDVTYCPTGSDPSPSITGTSGGTFTFLPSGLSLNLTSGEIDLRLSNSGTYVITYTTPGSCQETQNANIEILPTLNADWNALSPICENSVSLDLNPLIMGNMNGTWSGTGVTGTLFNPTGLTGLIPITYTVGNAGCTWSKIQNVLIHNLDASIVVDNPEGCQDHCVEFSIDPINVTGTIVSHNWIVDGATGNGNTLPYCLNHPGFYSISVDLMDDIGCSKSFSEIDIVQVFPNPEAEIGATSTHITTAESPIKLFNQSSGESYFSWTLPEGLNTIGSPLIYPISDTGTYEFYLFVETAFGCRDSTSILVKVDPLESIFAPNAITPNDDGINDIFQVFVNDATVNELIIFNRWGEIIFQSNESTGINWDAKIDGRIVPNGVYSWKVNYSSIAGSPKNKTGHLSVIGEVE